MARATARDEQRTGSVAVADDLDRQIVEASTPAVVEAVSAKAAKLRDQIENDRRRLETTEEDLKNGRQNLGELEGALNECLEFLDKYSPVEHGWKTELGC